MLKRTTARIVQRTYPSGDVRYVIQQRHFLFRWWWVDAWLNDGSASCQDTFETLDEAKKNMHLFNNTKNKDTVVCHA